MPASRRCVRINKKKDALAALGTDPSGLSVLLSLAQENPGQPLRTFIRARIKEILAAHPDKPELLVDVREIMDVMMEARLKKERLLKVRKEPKTPPFPIPTEFVGKFVWTFRLNRLSEVVWQMVQV
jgi:hypothetical protein